VLATNVAETSLTVPGIKYVIDPGTARISRYSYRTKVQRLPIEPVSQASANQRKGRCGRVSKGSVFVFIPKTISCRARNLPTRKFCVPTWRPLFCR
jgi:HrpA-like RNA helicase